MNQSDLGSVLELKESVCKAFVLVATSVRSCIVNAAVNQQQQRAEGAMAMARACVKVSAQRKVDGVFITPGASEGMAVTRL
jgi:hypothetical protein